MLLLGGLHPWMDLLWSAADTLALKSTSLLQSGSLVDEGAPRKPSMQLYLFCEKQKGAPTMCSMFKIMIY